MLSRFVRRIRRTFTPAPRRSVVLVYHSVADVRMDPWEIHVSPDRFVEQLRAINENFAAIPLQELCADVTKGRVPRTSVALTFDDGYANNLLTAVPLLEQHEIPATVFATTDFIGNAQESWWDELERILLQANDLPAEAVLEIDGEFERLDFDGIDQNDAQRAGAWLAWTPPTNPRQAAYARLWERLSTADSHVRSGVLSSLAAQVGTSRAARATHRMMTEEELRVLGRCSYIEIGAHSVSHPMLSQLSPEQQHAEVIGGREILERKTGRPIRSFAYPYGQPSHYTDETVDIVRSAGYSCACINSSGAVTESSDVFRLPRLHVRNWDGEEFTRQVRRLLGNQ